MKSHVYVHGTDCTQKKTNCGRKMNKQCKHIRELEDKLSPTSIIFRVLSNCFPKQNGFFQIQTNGPCTREGRVYYRVEKKEIGEFVIRGLIHRGLVLGIYSMLVILHIIVVIFCMLLFIFFHVV